MAETADLNAVFDALSASGAAKRHPVRFVYLDALARRAAGQPEAIRQLLNARISAAASELNASPGNLLSKEQPTVTASPLAELLAYIDQHSAPHPEATQLALPNATVNPNSRRNSELKSVAYFRDEWSKLSNEQQLTQTLAQAPENAGPMNSQHLVLRSLQVMRDIAPDYLAGFMSYIDTLIWLEHATQTKPAATRSSGGDGQDRKRTAKRSVTNR